MICSSTAPYSSDVSRLCQVRHEGRYQITFDRADIQRIGQNMVNLSILQRSVMPDPVQDVRWKMSAKLA
jgi:hypothetical protein